MDHDAVTESKRLAGLDREAAIFCFVIIEIALAKWIHREQAVAAGMPVRGMLRIPRVIEYRDAELFSFQLAGVIHPVRSLSPDFLLTFFALGVHHQARALGIRQRVF